ncbi:MAG: polysaccharide deacetylase family protein [Acidobacteria bacterium]|nr:polysaccharide deacetylase family protein [Acidobacteriota bacterium]
MDRHAPRWRWHIKAALAAAIARAHAHGLASSAGRPLVLGYHRVVDDYAAAARTEMPGMLISAAMFERHLDWIGRRFQFVTLDEIGEHIAAGRHFDRPVAAVTFDDGYRDVYEHAFPVLRRKGIPATVFVVTDLVGKPFWQVHDKLYQLVAKAFSVWRNPHRELTGLFAELGLPADGIRHRALANPFMTVSWMLPALAMADVRRVMDGIEAAVGNGFQPIPRTVGWPELAEMQRAGITVGSHTRNHVSLPMETPEQVAVELEESRRTIEERLGRPVAHFAYPGGQFTLACVDAVAKAGYRFAYTACGHGDPQHRALTIERLLLWEGSSVDANGRFCPDILECQINGLWPPSRRCHRVHKGGQTPVMGRLEVLG